ncbi:NAD(+) synthase [Clostridiaceae bacterium DONG20-135]|uniref:Glutamine-dependent NAD(+) synthetase n=1 Tax=Copranaerobaculum intestinale TaxID=2692629 RepID=A0A6N8U9N5_9FIRM|nr:NAD(+) synthase [Copranaerobaculum intestinale]MXQ74195.1 NAD(+) synthase [Copranaerobaculum intestinale]
MKIACIEMNVKAGKCEENFTFMKEQIEAAKRENADLIVFPQNAVSGYLLGDKWLDDDWCQYVDSFNEKITKLADSIAIVWGNIRYRHRMRFNSAFFAYQGKTYMRVKRNQDHFFFQDSRYFKESDINAAIEYQDLTLALNFGYEQQIADLNINIDCSPWIYDKPHVIKGSTVYVNAMGIQNIGKNISVFDGSCVVTQNHQVLVRSKAFQTGIVWSNVHECFENPSLLDALLFGVKEFDAQLLGGNMPWIVGLSGGLDSSVTAAVLTMALGKERVIGYNMATRYNSDKTVSNASGLAEKLGIAIHEGSIELLMESSVNTVKEYGYDEESWNSLVKENMQARLRGHLLSTFASIHNGVVVNNGNKVEAALGYCTLYGDAIGALCVIGDVSKVQLFDIAKEINHRLNVEAIPQRLLPVVHSDGITWEMPPSAELKQDQLDPMKWFYHDYIIEHLHSDLTITAWMRMYLDKTAFDTPAGRWLRYYGLDDPQAFIDDLDWLVQTMTRNGFKRIQFPPILCISANPYGNAYIETQSQFDEAEYQKLRDAILKQPIQ